MLNNPVVEKIIYAIIASSHDLSDINGILGNIQGLSGSALYFLSYKSVSVAVSDYSSATKMMNKEMAIRFAGIIEEMAQKVTLLPVRFGTIVKSDEVIREMIACNYANFVTNLKHVENKQEFGLKVIWDYEKGVQKIREKEESLNVKADDYFSKNTIHTDYLFEKIKRHRLDDTLLNHVEHLIEEIMHYFSGLNPDCKFKKMVTKEIILDAVFLIEKGEHVRIISAIEALKLKHDDLRFLLTGPWAPYSFAYAANGSNDTNL